VKTLTVAVELFRPANNPKGEPAFFGTPPEQLRWAVRELLVRDEKSVVVYLSEMIPDPSRPMVDESTNGERDVVDGWVRPWDSATPHIDGLHPLAWEPLPDGSSALKVARRVGSAWSKSMREVERFTIDLVNTLDLAEESGYKLEIQTRWPSIAVLPIILRGLALAFDTWWKLLIAVRNKLFDDSTKAESAIHRVSAEEAQPRQSKDTKMDLDHLLVDARLAWARNAIPAMMDAHADAEEALKVRETGLMALAPYDALTRAARYSLWEGAWLLVGGPYAPKDVQQLMADELRSSAPWAGRGGWPPPPPLPTFALRDKDKPGSIAELRTLEGYAFVGGWFGRLAELKEDPTGAGTLLKTGAPRTVADAALLLEAIIQALTGQHLPEVKTEDLFQLAEACARRCAEAGNQRGVAEALRWVFITSGLSHDEESTLKQGHNLVRFLHEANMYTTASRVRSYLKAWQGTKDKEERLERLWQIALLYHVPPEGQEWPYEDGHRQPTHRPASDVLRTTRPGRFKQGGAP
jgi:hypothetical protein